MYPTMPEHFLSCDLILSTPNQHNYHWT